MKYILLVIAFLIVSSSFVQAESETKMASYSEISATELLQKIANKETLFLLDVRQPEEYQQDHIAGATLIPLGELASRLNEIPRDKLVVVTCRSGHRSARAADILVQNGFQNVENLEGGMIKWNDSKQ